MNIDPSTIAIATGLALGQMVFRTLPVVLYTALSRSVPAGRKLAICGGAVGVTALLEYNGLPILDAITRGLYELAVFAVAACAIYAVRGLVAKAWLGRPVMMVLCATLFACGPAALTEGVMAVEFATVGWELMFSAYSFACGTHRRSDVGFRDCLFFVLVDPTLVWRRRSQHMGIARSDTFPPVGPGLLRCGLGILTITAQHGLAMGLSLLSVTDPAALSPLGATRQFATYYFVYNYTLYFAHSGLASMQIGIMALIGWKTPERYNLPILSTGPADFWNRWNIWLGDWIRLHFFMPVALALRRSGIIRSKRIALAIAVLSSFLFSGAMHDIISYVPRHAMGAELTWGFTALFVLFGVTVVAQQALEPILRRIGLASRKRVAIVIYKSVFTTLHPIIGWLALPALTGNRMHPVFTALLLQWTELW